MTPDQGYLTTEDGVRLFFQRVGHGPKTVVIPNGFHLLNDFEHLSDAYTLIVYDLRNRGWSLPISDASKLARGIHNDVDDLEAVRRHFEISQIDLIGHSYLGLMVILYAMKFPDSVNRVANRADGAVHGQAISSEFDMGGCGASGHALKVGRVTKREKRLRSC